MYLCCGHPVYPVVRELNPLTSLRFAEKSLTSDYFRSLIAVGLTSVGDYKPGEDVVNVVALLFVYLTKL